MRRTLLATASSLIVLGWSSLALAGFAPCPIESVTKFDDHPQGGPPGIESALGLATSPAAPGGQPLINSVLQDAGGGNGPECGEPGNANNANGGQNPNGAPQAND